MSSISTKLRKAVRHPGDAVTYAASVARTPLVRAWCALRGVRLTMGRNVRIGGWLSVRGPGRVVIGDNVIVEQLVTAWTYSPDAVIAVGSHTYLNGTRFGCQERIDIGARCIVADARLTDTDFHSVRADRHSPAAPVRVRPIVLEDNVWLASAVGVLPGTRVGRNSVVGFGAVCAGSYPADSVIAGNPAQVIRPVPAAPAEEQQDAAATPPALTATAPAERARQSA